VTSNELESLDEEPLIPLMLTQALTKQCETLFALAAQAAG
jgi:hypothetical protein